MADWSLPKLGSLYTSWREYISSRLDDCARMFDSAETEATNLPEGTKRWNTTSSKWEKYTSGVWEDLASNYSINISGSAASADASALSSDSSKLGGKVPSYYQTALGFTPINKAGDVMTGTLQVYIAATPTKGTIYLGNTSDRYLHYNGSYYTMPGGELYVNSGIVLRSNNAKTINSTSLWGAGDISVQPTLVSGSNIKTVGGVSLLGSGDVSISSGLGVGQTWQNVTRTSGVTYYNTTGKPIAVVGFPLFDDASLTLAIGGGLIAVLAPNAFRLGSVFGIVPPDQSYVLTNNHSACRELR